MDDEAETYKLWKIRKTVMQVKFIQHNQTFFLLFNFVVVFSS